MNPVQSDSGDQAHPHLTQAQINALLGQLKNADEPQRSEIITRLAWRPAWAIRSRRGAWSALKTLFR